MSTTVPSPVDDGGRRYLDPDVLSAVGSLEMRARSIVEGFISGMHKSPFKGFSVEFAQHREYVAGDDIRHIDWKVFAKSDKYFIKEFEEETNLSCYLLLDVSESMRYGDHRKPGEGFSKIEYAATAAAGLGHLLLQQKDAVGMVLFDEELQKVFPASNKPSYLRDLLSEIDKIKPEKKTDLGPLLHQLAEEFKRRRVVIMFSDLFCDLEPLFEAFKHLRFNRHEVIVFHTMDEDELTFPFQRSTLFKGMEQWPNLLTDPKSLRRAYLEAIGRFKEKVERRCQQIGVEYVPLSTADRLDVTLARYLAARQAGRTRA